MQNSTNAGVVFGPELNYGVTAISRVVFGELAAMGVPTEDAARDAKRWRRNYTQSFSAAVPLEFSNGADAKLAALLDSFVSLARIQDGTPLREALAQAWGKPNLVELRLVAGNRSAEAIRLPDCDWSSDAQRQVEWGLAEPALLAAANALDRLQGPTALPPLIAFAGGAELSSVEHWLRWGGEVLMMARTSGSELEQLETIAANSAGRLWVASEKATGKLGIDLVVRPDLAAAAISQFVAANRGRNLLFGHFGYAPGLNHLRLEAVAQALTELLLQQVSAERLQFAWLATPTDSLAVPLDFAKQRRQHWSERSAWQRVGEMPWRIFGYLKPPTLVEFIAADGESLAILDSAARLQGPSYSLAKRIQRWRAHTLRSLGALTSYQITPPARTDSVLRHKILRATYRGSARFAIHPFDSFSASVWPAALFALDSQRERLAQKGDRYSATDWYFSRAIHGGLWRTRYEAASVWVPATALGLVLPSSRERS